MLPEFMNLLCKFDLCVLPHEGKNDRLLYRQTETTLLSQGGFSLLNAWAETGETLRSFSIKRHLRYAEVSFYTFGDEWIFGENCRI